MVLNMLKDFRHLFAKKKEESAQSRVDKHLVELENAIKSQESLNALIKELTKKKQSG